MAGGGGGGGGAKQDDLTPHPVKDQLPGVSYCITSPPPWRKSPPPVPPRLLGSGLQLPLGSRDMLLACIPLRLHSRRC
jgi:hypothetical protein